MHTIEASASAVRSMGVLPGIAARLVVATGCRPPQLGGSQTPPTPNDALLSQVGYICSTAVRSRSGIYGC
jgi:hypothetical protein